MKITLCGSIKFFDNMIEIQKQLEANGHEVYRPIKVENVDYFSEDGSSRVEAKKSLNLAKVHLDKIEASDAILVCNYTKGDIENYIGASTFLEMAFAHYRDKKIFVLNSLPHQKYIDDELQAYDAIILNGNLGKVI
ncbi:MAG: hypothetical protein WAX44_00630 [Minisyncoccia bacterium]